jgi:hypothetical protein
MGVIESHDDIESLLSIIDPHNNKQMTYSEVVQLLSSVTILRFIKPIFLVNGPS